MTITTTQREAALRLAMRKAFGLGQTYWQQADSESYSQNAKAEVTAKKFADLADETCAALLRELLAEPQSEPGAAYKQGYEDALNDCIRNGLEWARGMFANDAEHIKTAEPQGEPAAWIQPDHLQKARVAPFLCRVEPTKRMSDFVPLYAAPQQRHPLPEAAGFDHALGAGRFTVVKGAFWWHIRIGDSTNNVGKFHSKMAAENMALTLLTAFRDGAYTQYMISLSQQRKPLTDEQIDRLDTQAIHGGPDSQYAFRFARAIERDHGIEGAP